MRGVKTSRADSSQKRKVVACKQCGKQFADISKRNEHKCSGGSRYYECDQCNSKYKIKDNFVKHRQAKHSTSVVVVRKKVGSKMRKENDSLESLEMNANIHDFGEFVVDALYLESGSLNCRVRNLECFNTKNAFEMKAHREKYHALLENRISFKKWRHLIPERFLKYGLSETMDDAQNVTVDVTKIIQNAKPVEKAPLKNADAKIEDRVRKDFREYLVKLRKRSSGL